jgi:hypothetical protein
MAHVQLSLVNRSHSSFSFSFARSGGNENGNERSGSFGAANPRDEV